jgi:hypothetical protein
MSEQIFSVSYDEPLLRTREVLLQRQGYSVTPALGFTAAVEVCNASHFDLLILGHSIPHKDKVHLMTVFREMCSAPILALQRHGDQYLDGADAHVYPDDIETLLQTVDNVLRKGTQTAEVSRNRRANLMKSFNRTSSCGHDEFWLMEGTAGIMALIDASISGTKAMSVKADGKNSRRTPTARSSCRPVSCDSRHIPKLERTGPSGYGATEQFRYSVESEAANPTH